MISDLSDLENLIKLEPDSISKTKKLHLLADIRHNAKNSLERIEVLEKLEKHHKSKLERMGLENGLLRQMVGGKE